MTSGTIKVHVLMLDNKVHSYDIKHKSDGIVLLQAVLKDLNLLEADYFGLLFKDNEENNVFLDTNKKLNIQIPNNASMELKFVVKFFPPDPSLLQEEYTRYLFALQIKQDINQGLLFCNDSTLATMASYIAQSEFGDWNSKDCSSLTYLKHMNILPDNYNEINIFSIISEHHKANMGQSQAEADFNLLNIARRLESYGLRLHSATSNDGNELKLSVNYSGVVIFRGTTKTNTFVWNQIRKLSFRKKRFLIKLKKEMNNDSFYSNSGDVVVLLMKSRDACKTFWRQCIEHHTFFRKDVRPEPKPQPLLLKRGSTFRYSGKTQKQLHELVSNSNFKRSAFIRTYNRTSCSSSRVTGNTWTSSQNGASDTVTSLQTRVQAKTELSKAASTVLPSSVENESASKIETKSTDEITVAGSWQEDSGNLHGGSDFVKQQSHRTQPGNNHVTTSHARTNSNEEHRTKLPNPDLLNDVDNIVFNRVRSDANDGSEFATQKAAASRSGNRSLDRSSSSASHKSCNYPLPPPPPPPPEEINTDSSSLEVDYNISLPTPPPLPPKLGSPPGFSDQNSVNETSSPDVSSIDLNNVVRRRKLSAFPSDSEASIPGLSVESRTPSQYEKLGREMIRAGHYSVPSKPPIDPPDNDDDLETIQRALNDLDRATKSLTRNSLENCESGSSMEANSADGVGSSDISSSIPNQHHASVQMNVDEQCTSSEFSSTDVLKNFANEMEESFEQIRQSISNEQLDGKVLTKNYQTLTVNTSFVKKIPTLYSSKQAQQMNGSHKDFSVNT